MAATSKRLLFLVLSFVLFLQVGVLSVSAESNICTVIDNAEQLSTTVNSEGLTIFGYFGEKSGYPVYVTVKDADEGSLIFLEQVMTGDGGHYSLLIPYETNMLGKNYKVTVGCVTDNKLYEKTLAFLPGQEPEALLQMVNQATTEDEMADFISSYGLDVGISLSALEEIDAPEAVYAALTGESYATMEAFRKSFNKALAVQKQKKANVFEIHVAPNGSDTNKATAESPLATIEAAMQYADYLMALGSEDNFEILLHGGEYKVTKEILIEKKPERKNHITIKNFNDEQPVLNGSSQAITGWEQYSGNIYRAKVPMGLDIKVLFENNNMLTMARYPNKQASYENMYSEFVQADSYNNSLTQFTYRAGTLPQMADMSNLEVGMFAGGSDGYFMWGMNVLPVSSIDTASRLVTLQEPASYNIGTDSYYFWQGALELLDAPGEFYHNPEVGYIYYYPTDGMMEGKTITYPVIDNMITIGNSDGSTISDITIDGIGICGTNRSAKMYSHSKSNEYGNGVLILNADNVAVKNCEIHAVGGNGITSNQNLKNSVISSNHIYDGGQNGIILYGFDYVKVDNLIDNNYVHHMSKILHSSSGISISGVDYADGNVISHNRIHDLKRIGINVGGSTEKYLTGDNVIEYNDISACCNGSDDSGLIYLMLTLGTNIVRNNYLHDGYSKGSYRAIYPDEASHNTIIEGNLITRMQGNIYHLIQAKGDDIQIKNNYFMDSPTAYNSIVSYMRWESGQHTERMKIENNIFYNSGKTMYYHYFMDKSTKRIENSDQNLFYNATSSYIQFKHSTTTSSASTNYSNLSKYQENGYELNSVMGNPNFISNTGGDVRYAYGSLAEGLGIKPLELDKMGLRESFKYVDGDNKPYNLFVRDAKKAGNAGYIQVGVGEQVQLASLVRTAGGFVIPADSVTVTYTLGAQNGNVVLGADGVLTGLKVGVVRVMATAETATGTVTSEFDIMVSSEGSANAVVSLDGMTVKNQAEQLLTQVESGVLTVSVAVTPKQNTAAKLFVAYTDANGRLITSGVSEDATLTKNTPSTLVGSITIPEETTGELYVYIWDGIATLKPLYSKITVF
ncbi:MAG: right-handed parallel beta-helix repeat-containing protein [Clostridia bacterium]|nr:right-handed parallel beta-helix repeat-containing protein [Clostridia bacterium]